MRKTFALWTLAAASAAASDVYGADKTSLGCIQASDAAQTARDEGNLLRSRELFAQCSEAKCPAMIRRDCTSWLEQVQQQTPSVVLGMRDADGRDVLDARVTVDGVAIDQKALSSPIELNPGPHVVRWESAAHEAVEMRIALRAQEKNRQVVATLSRATVPPAADAGTRPLAPTLLPAPSGTDAKEAAPKGGLPVATYVLGGVGAAALGVFTYFGLRAKHDSASLHDTCAPGCAHNDVTALRTKLVVADVALGVGAVSVAAAVVFALGGRSRSPSAAWNVQVVPTRGGARAELGVSF
jgi:hypothetical protein